MFEALSGGIAELLENQNRDLLATKIELKGKVDSPETSTLSVLWGIFKNGFIDAYKINVEDSVSLDGEAKSRED